MSTSPIIIPRIGAETKLSPLMTRQFQIHFLIWTSLYLGSNVTEGCSQALSRCEVSIGCDNGSAPNKRQSIIWIDGDTVHWSKHASPGPRRNMKTAFPGMGISIIKISRSHNYLIFKIGTPILIRRRLYIETVSWTQRVPNSPNEYQIENIRFWYIWNIRKRLSWPCNSAVINLMTWWLKHGAWTKRPPICKNSFQRYFL